MSCLCIPIWSMSFVSEERPSRSVNGWLFGNLDTGKPYHSDTMRQRHLNWAAAEIGLPKLEWHAFRHTFRARLSELGL
jgi:integrase